MRTLSVIKLQAISFNTFVIYSSSHQPTSHIEFSQPPIHPCFLTACSTPTLPPQATVHWKCLAEVCNLNVTFICHTHYYYFCYFRIGDKVMAKFNSLLFLFLVLTGQTPQTTLSRSGNQDRELGALWLHQSWWIWAHVLFSVLLCVWIRKTTIATNFGYRTCSNYFNVLLCSRIRIHCFSSLHQDSGGRCKGKQWSVSEWISSGQAIECKKNFVAQLGQFQAATFVLQPEQNPCSGYSFSLRIMGT